MKAFKLKVTCASLALSFLFTEHPTKNDIRKLISRIWNRLPGATQDQTFDMLLLAELAPDILFLSFTTWIGELDIQEIIIYDNHEL